MEKISEQEFVERYGNAAQKEKYAAVGKLVGSNKRSVMNAANKYCTAVALPDGTYKITKQKKMAVTPDFIRTASGVYPFTCPLVLQYVMNHDRSVIGTMSLSTSIKMMADYYGAINGNPEIVADVFRLEKRAVYDYLEHVTDSVNYYIRQTLDYLKQMQLILYTTSYIFIKGDASAVQDGVALRVQKHIATSDDMMLYKSAVAEADAYAETKSASERYYSEKAKKWNAKMHELLSAQGIMNVFPVYEVWTVNKDKCREYRSQFDEEDVLVTGLGKEFRQKVYDNAFKRLSKKPRLEDEMADILLAYNFLSRICIGNPKLSLKTEEKIKKIVDMNGENKYKLIVEEC